MKVQRRPRPQGPLIHALYLNAALLLAILAVLLFRGNGPGLSSPAFGAPQMMPIAGGGGVFLMPAQFSINTWGCYLMDIDSQNICAYQYIPGERQLKFVAARNYREDRKLRDWNTSPPPAEIARMNQTEKSGIRGTESAPDAAPLPVPAPAPDFPQPVGPPNIPSPGVPSPSGLGPPTSAPIWTSIPLNPTLADNSTEPAAPVPSQPATKGQ
jgi:hypothetical protein